MIGPPGAKKPMERPKNSPPPCSMCPKKGPEHEKEFILSERNIQTLIFYRETRSTFGRGLSEEEAQDSIVRRNFSILDNLFAEAERKAAGYEASRALAGQLTQR